jgi:hypothetical protein
MVAMIWERGEFQNANLFSCEMRRICCHICLLPNAHHLSSQKTDEARVPKLPMPYGYLY